MKGPLFRSGRLAPLSAAILLATLSPNTAWSQGTVVEEMSIVGSRIIRRDETSSSPVQTLDEEDLREDGSLSIGETMQALPYIGPSLNSNGSAGTSHGSSSLNLRNLGENRALVLVNGHRWVNGAGTRGFRDFVDLNTIPQAMIQRIEVLQDGATAIYGADAIAGVVNMHTYSNFEGLRIKGTYGEASEGDRETTGVDILAGRNFGDSNWMLAISYVDQEPIYTQDRSLTAVPLNGLSLGTPELLFRENNVAPFVTGYVSGEGITRDPGVDGSVTTNWRKVNTATDVYNRYDNNYVVGPLERTSIFLQNTTPIGDATEFRLEVLYNERKSDQQFSEVLSSIQGSRGFTIPNNPAVNPFGVTFSGSDFRVTGFHTENGYRVNAQEVETLRIGVGLNGELDNSWRWDTFLSWAENEATFESRNQLDLERMALGMRNCSASGIVADVSDLLQGCVPVNLFNPLTPAMVDYINFTGRDVNKAEQLDFTANLTGDLFELPAGPLQFATGIEYREEKGLDTPDSYINATPRVLSSSYQTTSSSPRDGTDAEYDLSEIYVEFSVPLLMDAPLAQELRADLATRYSDYSTFGDTTNSKAGLAWRPVNDLLLRTTWAEGFRAPSLLELYEGSRLTDIPIASDPCSGGGAGKPGCAGVPGSYVFTGGNVPATVGGNPNLDPETSENVSFGFVYTPYFFEGFSLTMDWYDIEIQDTITSYGAQNIINLCANQGLRCNFVQRDGSGEIVNVADGPVNLNSTEVKGLDIVARYGTITDFGDFDITVSASKLRELTERVTQTNGTVTVTDKVGFAGLREAYPDWRGTTSVQWRMEPWGVNYSTRYIGDTTEAGPRKIPSRLYHNIAGSYDVTEALTVRLGVDNVEDTQPPVSLTNVNINFDQNTYSAVGRYIYMQLTWEM